MTIADGHHRYETALRYRDERRMARSCEEDPAFDYLLMLFLDAGEPLTVLPTHRIVRGLGDDGVGDLLAGLDELFEVRGDVAAEALRDRFDAAGARARAATAGSGSGRARAAWSCGRAACAFEPLLPAGGEALRRLDVTLLGVALERLAGIDADAVAGRARRVHEVGGRGHRARRRRGRWRGRRVPARADAGRVGRWPSPPTAT